MLAEQLTESCPGSGGWLWNQEAGSMRLQSVEKTNVDVCSVLLYISMLLPFERLLHHNTVPVFLRQCDCLREISKNISNLLLQYISGLYADGCVGANTTS